MRIPKRVNAVLDWAEKHARGVSITVICLVLVGCAFLLPLFAALGLGAVIGGLVVYAATAANRRKLLGEIDELLRQNGSLRHERTVLASGVIATETQDTAQLMVIPAEAEPEPAEVTTRVLKVITDDEVG